MKRKIGVLAPRGRDKSRFRTFDANGALEMRSIGSFGAKRA
jgi:hypothetical protein